MAGKGTGVKQDGTAQTPKRPCPEAPGVLASTVCFKEAQTHFRYILFPQSVTGTQALYARSNSGVQRAPHPSGNGTHSHSRHRRGRGATCPALTPGPAPGSLPLTPGSGAATAGARVISPTFITNVCYPPTPLPRKIKSQKWSCAASFYQGYFHLSRRRAQTCAGGGRTERISSRLCAEQGAPHGAQPQDPEIMTYAETKSDA